MTRATTLLALGATLMLAGPTTASAQTADQFTKYFAIYGGAQPQRRTIDTTTQFDLFEETATITSEQRIRNGGIFKVGAGFPIGRHFGVGGGVSIFGRPGTAVVSARVPSPYFTDTFTTVVVDTDDLTHREIGINFNVQYYRQLTPKLNLTLMVGPSLIRVQQDIANVAVNNTTVAVTSDKLEESGNAFGVNGGADVVYQLRSSVGLGLFVHYLGGKLDLPSAEDVTVGGPQVGLVLKVGL